MTLPNFIIAGAAKAGTTTLYDMLAQHPEVGMSIMKEPNYFSDGWPNWAETINEYQQLFKHCVGKKAIGEASPFYFSDPESAGRIKNTLGDNVKIIIILRNPAKRTYSHWAFTKYIYNRDSLSFHQALEQEEERAFSQETRKLKHYYPGVFRYVWVSMYSEKVQQYLDIFGKDNLRVVILEELVQRPKEQLREIFEFLNVDSTFIPELIKSNPAGESAVPRFTKLISSVNQSKFFNSIYRKLPFALKKTIFNFGNSIFERLRRPRKLDLSEQELMDEETYDRLMERFMPDIKRLEQILGQDLSIWY